MSNRPQGPPQGMMLPFIVPHQPQQQQMQPCAPPVVQEAFRYLELCIGITEDEAHVICAGVPGGGGTSSIEIAKGRKLDTAEAKAKLQALGLLRDYFEGKLPGIHQEQGDAEISIALLAQVQPPPQGPRPHQRGTIIYPDQGEEADSG